MATSQKDNLSIMAMKAPKVSTNWEERQLLGKGAFGEVYRCYDKDTGYEYAVKMVKLSYLGAEMSKDVQNEIKLLSKLQHERIVQYFGYQNDGKVLSIFLEYMAGGSVKNLIDEIGELQESLVKKYSRQVLLSLAYLHNMCIVHRDINAANILRDTKGNVKLCDFKLASTHCQTICSDERVVTYNWMAPEVIIGEDYDSKADIWSLGCTIVEMLSSKPPFHKYKTAVSAMFKIVHCKHPEYKLPLSVSSLVEEFLLHTFQKTPADRWSAEELLRHRFVCDEEAYGVVDDISISLGELNVNKGVVADVVQTHYTNVTVVTDKDLDRLAAELPGQGWQPFMRELLRNEIITKIIENYKHDVHEQIFQCLKKWKQGLGVKATKDILQKALKEHELNLASQTVFGIYKDD